MRKNLCTPWIWALPLLVLAAAGTARADHPLAGKWKINVLSGGVELSPWIIQIDEDKGKFSAKLIAAGIKELSPVAFDRVTVSDKGVHLDMIHSGELLYLSAYPPKA